MIHRQEMPTANKDGRHTYNTTTRQRLQLTPMNAAQLTAVPLSNK